MSRLVEPLVEEPFQSLARGLLHGLAEVISLDDLELVLGDVTANALPPAFLTQQAPQHMEDTSSFGVGHPVKHLHW